MGLLFKVLSGPHQGAEFDLPEEEITIGAADECDVIISDALVADRHMKVSLIDGHVFITPLNGNVFVGGKLLREPSTVDSFQFVTIGATHMMFGETDSEQWQTIALGNFPELEKVEEEVSTFSESTEEGGEVVDEEGKALNDGGVENIESTELADREGEAAAALEKPKTPTLTIRQRIVRYGVGFILCVVIAAGTSIAYVFLSEEKPEPIVPPPIEKRVQ
ncbi:MAG: FHA domain-containing protein, partial [Puniceicoccales bacterium]|nr:FHA domain-containing protein [Puniceicoccales bacterium]